MSTWYESGSFRAGNWFNMLIKHTYFCICVTVKKMAFIFYAMLQEILFANDSQTMTLKNCSFLTKISSYSTKKSNMKSLFDQIKIKYLKLKK